MSERWLTFDDLCFELRLPPKQVKKLIKAGRLVGICTGKKMNLETDWRYLDPSDKYKKMLENQVKNLNNLHNSDLLELPLLNPAEFAAIAGITAVTIRGLIFNKKLNPLKIGKYSYFSPAQVREFLLRRERKEPRSRRARCELLLRWALAQLEKNQEEILTPEQIENDDLLESTMARLLRLKEPERTRAIQEFWRRYQLAKDVAAVIKSAGD